MSKLNKNKNNTSPEFTPSIKVLKKIHFIPRTGKSFLSVLVERQFGAIAEKGIIPINDFHHNPELLNLIGLVDLKKNISKQDIFNKLDNLCLEKNVITLIDKFGYCKIDGREVFVHSEGTITGMFSPDLPFTSSNLKLHFGHCNLMSLSTEDSEQELVSDFLSLLNISKSNPGIGTLLMAKITREALLHFKDSNVSVFFVNNGITHSPSVSKLSKITYDKYLIDPFAIDSYSLKPKQKTLIKNIYPVYCKVKGDDIDLDVFSETYVLTSDTRFSKVMKLFIQYLVNNYESIEPRINSTFKKYKKETFSRAKGEANSLAIADLMIGITMFLRFCVSEQYLSNKEAKAMSNSQLSILTSLINSK